MERCSPEARIGIGVIGGVLAPHFMNHQLAKIDGIYYDPSYGKKYASVAELDKSLAGYRKPGGGKTFFYKKNPGDGKNLKEYEEAATGVDP